jgi:hypothetical protein
MFMPGWGDTRGPRGRRVELAGGDGLADGHVALRPAGGHVEQDAARGDAVEVGVDRAPGGAGRGEAVLERPPVEQLAVPGHVAERVDVSDREAVVDEVEAVQHDVGPLAVRREGDVVHERRRGADVARERHGAAGADERRGLGALGGGDQVRGAALIVVAPAAPVVQVLEVALEAVLRGWRPVGHGWRLL